MGKLKHASHTSPYLKTDFSALTKISYQRTNEKYVEEEISVKWIFIRKSINMARGGSTLSIYIRYSILIRKYTCERACIIFIAVSNSPKWAITALISIKKKNEARWKLYRMIAAIDIVFNIES